MSLTHLKSFKSLFLRVRFSRFILLIGFVTVVSVASAQDDTPRRGSRIIDDTTKQIYGPKTSRYYFEKDVFMNRQTYHFIDTVPRNFHRYTYIQQNNYMYQDLGNIGTSMNPIYYQVPDIIGVTSGFRQNNLIWDTEEVKYYDTKSPYSNMRVILGGKGRSITKATYSRNINPRWNFGFNYRGLFIDKQVQRAGKGDRNVVSNYYDLYTAYQSKDSTYRLFFNFRRNSMEADEYGGISQTSTSFTYADYFDANALPSLTQAISRELRMNIHLAHQYEVGKALQVYHVFDRYRQGNSFQDTPGSETKNYFDHTEYDSTTSYDAVKFKTLRNEIGIKGNLLKLFYNGYYAIRNYSMNYNYIDPDTLSLKTKGAESYLGGRMALRLDSIGEVSGWVEVMQTGNYRIEGSIKSPWFEASLKQVQYAPSFLHQAYRGSHDVWYPSFTYSTDFHNVNVTQINGYIHYNSSVLSVSPGLTFTRLGNYVFFKEGDYDLDQKVMPVQSSGQQVFVAPELNFTLTMAKHIRLTGKAIYNHMLKNDDDAIQIPQLFVNGQLSYENIFFNGNLDMHTGVDVHWNSTYYALGYDVPIQQFYVQKSFQSKQFPLIDIFFSTRIKRGRIFLKYNNLMQAFTKQGYMPTPYYPGQRSILDFGFDWSFYD
ncbi:MAG TPA: putative porin [Ohtaekwangia sp.]